jgi:hypothetical protein
MRRDHNPGADSSLDTDPPASTPRDEVEWLSETEPSDEGFSLVDPLFYAPLLLVGAGLVVFPEPVTTLVGFACLAAGVTLLAVDIASALAAD